MNDELDYTLNSDHVHELTIQLLNQLPLEARGEQIQPEDILNALVFAAASTISINQACQQLEAAPSGATVLGELARQLDDIDELENDLNALLAQLLPKSLGCKGRRVAIDLVKLPYHGSLDAQHEGEVCRGKATSGTTHFFTYATAYVVLSGRRYTLALTRVRKGDKMVKVLKTLMRRLKVLGVRVSLLLVDRGFYSVRVIGYLIRRKQPFIMAATRRGKKADAEGGPTGTFALAHSKSSHWARYTLKSPGDGKVSFDMAVVCRNLDGKWGRHEREALLYATWGVRERSLGWVKQTYRRRFGIESSYRQLNQARIRTSTRNPALRLLFVGVALILRNVWVWLHAEVIALPRRGARVLRSACLRFQRLLIWLVFGVADHYGLLREVPIPRDFHEVAGEVGLIFNY
jgi:putative transposase